MPLELQGFTAWISSGKKELECYGAETSQDGKEVTCWIASEEGKEFTVHWTRPQELSKTAMSGRVQVDDIICPDTIMLAESQAAFSRSGFSTSPTTIKPFIFGKMQLTDDDAYLDAATSDKIGEISLPIGRIKMLGGMKKPTYQAPREQQNVHERSKKATTHRVILGDDIWRKEQTKSCNIRDVDKAPLVKFVFKYRPIEVLQANGVVVVSSTGKRKATDEPKQELMTDDEVEVEDTKTARIKALEDELRALRSQPAGPSKKAKRVKVEPLVPAGFVSGEVIDLT